MHSSRQYELPCFILLLAEALCRKCTQPEVMTESDTDPRSDCAAACRSDLQVITVWAHLRPTRCMPRPVECMSIKESHCVPCAVYCLLQADGLGGAGAALGMSLGASTPSSAGAGGGVGSTRITQLPPGTYKGPEITADGTVEARPELGNKTCTGCEQGCRALKVATNCKASLDYFDGRWSPVCSDDDSTAKAPCTCIVTCHPQSETQSLDTAPRPSKQSGAIGRWPGQVMLVFPAVALSLLLSVWG